MRKNLTRTSVRDASVACSFVIPGHILEDSLRSAGKAMNYWIVALRVVNSVLDAGGWVG